MFDRLEDLLIRMEEILSELQEPDVANDQARFRKLMKEQNDLSPIVEAYKEYKTCKQTIVIRWIHKAEPDILLVQKRERRTIPYHKPVLNRPVKQILRRHILPQNLHKHKIRAGRIRLVIRAVQKDLIDPLPLRGDQFSGFSDIRFI